MKFGAFLLLHSPDKKSSAEVYANAIAQAELADALGFDAVWLAEHHFSSYGYSPNPLYLAVKIAERTKKVRIGTAVVVLPLHHPLRLAEDIAMVDQLTGGRLEVGFGRGYQDYEFQRLGVPLEEGGEGGRLGKDCGAVHLGSLPCDGSAVGVSLPANTGGRPPCVWV